MTHEFSCTYCCLDTPQGKATARAHGNALSGFWFNGQKHFPSSTESWVRNDTAPIFIELQVWLTRYYAGEKPALHIPLVLRGTTFQQSVWAMLLKIPYGSLTTYGALQKQLEQIPGASPSSARAVGNAVGRNPISLLVPCHRVVGSGGKLTGYAGGLERKQQLLRLEGAVLL